MGIQIVEIIDPSGEARLQITCDVQKGEHKVMRGPGGFFGTGVDGCDVSSWHQAIIAYASAHSLTIEPTAISQWVVCPWRHLSLGECTTTDCSATMPDIPFTRRDVDE